MSTNPFAVTIPPTSTTIVPDNSALTLAQILDLSQQRQLRGLQVEQARRQMADIEAMRSQGGPFQTLQGLSNTIGQPQGQITQTPLSSPSMQAIPPGAGSGAVPEGQAPATSLVPGEPSSTAAPVPPPVQPAPRLSPADEHHQQNMRLMFEHPYAWQIYGKDIMELQKLHLDQQVQSLNMQKDALKMVSEWAASVEDRPPGEREAAYTPGYNLFKSWGLPGIEQLSPTYDPTQMGVFATNARDAAKRIEQTLEMGKLQKDIFGEQTKRLQAQIEGRKVGVSEAAEAREARRTEQYTSGQGLGVREVYPKPGTTGAQPLPAPAGGGVAMPTQTMETETAYDANQNIYQIRKNVPYGQTGQATRPQVVPPAFSAEPGQGGAAGTSGAGLKTPQMQERLMQPGLAATTEQLSEARQNADIGRSALNDLKELKQLAHQGYYDGIAAPKLASGDWPKLAQDLGVQDPTKLANTAAIQALASRVVTAMQQGHFRAGAAEVQKLSQAAGGLEGLPKKQTLMELVELLRRLNKQEIAHYNDLGARQPPASRPPHYGEAETPTISRADFEKRYRERQKVEPKLTRDDLALRYERGGYHVEGSD